MLSILGIAAAVIVATVLFALVGVRIGSQIEAKKLGAGITEEQLRGGFTASGLGGLLGAIPVVVFVLILIIMVATAPADPADHAASGGAPAAAH